MSLLPFIFSLSFTFVYNLFVFQIHSAKEKKPETYLYFDGNGNKQTLYY